MSAGDEYGEGGVNCFGYLESGAVIVVWGDACIMVIFSILAEEAGLKQIS